MGSIIYSIFHTNFYGSVTMHASYANTIGALPNVIIVMNYDNYTSLQLNLTLNDTISKLVRLCYKLHQPRHYLSIMKI